MSFGCGAEVVLEEDVVLEEAVVLDQGEGGYLGTGQPDRDSAVQELCGVLQDWLPMCPQDTCINGAEEIFEIGEKTGCAAEAVSLMYCAVLNANQYVCLGHHECDNLEEAFETCWTTVCSADPDLCGL